MSVIRISLEIQAPIERCFDLARCIDLHELSAAQTNEKAIGGRTKGLIELGEQVTWRARHLGVTQTLTAKITAFDRPIYFRDSMVSGAFARFDHDHRFEAQGAVTKMHDTFDFTSPLGPLGRLVDRVFLTRYMHNFLLTRNLLIKQVAESNQWRRFLPHDSAPE